MSNFSLPSLLFDLVDGEGFINLQVDHPFWKAVG